MTEKKLDWWHWAVLILLLFIFLLLLFVVIMLTCTAIHVRSSMDSIFCWFRHIIGKVITDVTYLENAVKTAISEFKEGKDLSSLENLIPKNI